MNFCQKDFGARVRSRRKALHMTQQELSERTHADAHHVGRIERGEKSVSIDLLIELSKALNVSIDFLLLGKGFDASLRAQMDSVIAQLTDIARKM